MNPDRVVWSGGTIGADELVDRFAYPGELEVLALLARRFPDVPQTGSPASALCVAVLPLIDGLERMGHGDPCSSPEWWSPEILTAYEALGYGSELVEAWRLFFLLPDERVIGAAHWPT